MKTLPTLFVHKDTRHKYYDWYYSWSGNLDWIIDRLEFWIEGRL